MLLGLLSLAAPAQAYEATTANGKTLTYSVSPDPAVPVEQIPASITVTFADGKSMAIDAYTGSQWPTDVEANNVTISRNGEVVENTRAYFPNQNPWCYFTIAVTGTYTEPGEYTVTLENSSPNDTYICDYDTDSRLTNLSFTYTILSQTTEAPEAPTVSFGQPYASGDAALLPSGYPLSVKSDLATSIIVKDAEGNEVATIAGNNVEWTPAEAGAYQFIASNDNGQSEATTLDVTLAEPFTTEIESASSPVDSFDIIFNGVDGEAAGMTGGANSAITLTAPAGVQTKDWDWVDNANRALGLRVTLDSPITAEGAYEFNATVTPDKLHYYYRGVSIYLTAFSATLKVTAPTGIDDIAAGDAAAAYYNLQGQRVSQPQGGVYVRVQGGKAVKVVK